MANQKHSSLFPLEGELRTAGGYILVLISMMSSTEGNITSLFLLSSFSEGLLLCFYLLCTFITYRLLPTLRAFVLWSLCYVLNLVLLSSQCHTPVATCKWPFMFLLKALGARLSFCAGNFGKPLLQHAGWADKDQVRTWIQMGWAVWRSGMWMKRGKMW